MFLDRRLLSRISFVWRETRSSFFLIPSPCKQFREQRPGEGLHSRWGKKSRRRQQERRRKRDVQDWDNEGKEMVERMVRTVIRERLRRGARTSDRTGHRRPSVHVNSSSISWREIARLDYSRHGSQRIAKWCCGMKFLSIAPQTVQYHRLSSLRLSKYTTSQITIYLFDNIH